MEKRIYANAEYISGTAARQLAPQWELPEREQERLPERERQKRQEEQTSPKTHRVPRVGHGIDFLSMLLLVGAIIATVYVCVEYLQVQSELVQLSKSVTATENRISAVEKENNALEAAINAAASDLDTIYQIAVGTLGMVYPNQNEVIYYEVKEDGYFRQYYDIPR